MFLHDFYRDYFAFYFKIIILSVRNTELDMLSSCINPVGFL